MKLEDKQAFATDLAHIAIIKLAVSAQGADLFSVFKSFANTEIRLWTEHMADGWPHYGDRFIEQAQKHVVEAIDKLKVPPKHLKRELIQAKVVLGKGAPNWRRLVQLGFSANAINNDIAENSGHEKTASPFSTTHVLFSALYFGISTKDEAYAELDLGINHQARKLLLSRNSAVKELNEAFGWAGLLNLGISPYTGTELSPAQLFEPTLNIIPYQHHTKHNSELQQWLESDKQIAVRLYGGPSGSGKTRSLLEICIHYSSYGWSACFLNEDAVSQQFPIKAYEQMFQRNNGVIIVVDHAQDRHKQLNHLLATAEQSTHKQRVRIVLLSRSTDANWLTYFHALASSDTQQLMRSTPIEYKDFPTIAHNSKQRHAIFDQASIAFAAELGLIPSNKKSVDLDAEHFSYPLYLGIAAMLALFDEKINISPKQLVLELLRHESKHWSRKGCDSQAVAQILSCVTLWQGAGKRQIARIQQQWPENAAASQANGDVLISLLEDLYGQFDNTIAPLRPDVLGEHLVSNTLTKHMRTMTKIAFSQRAADEQRKQACNIISRLPVDTISKSDQLGVWLSEQLKQQNDVVMAAQLIERFPSENSAFSALDERAAYILRKHLINQYSGSIDDKIALSLILNYHGVRIAQNGNLTGALKAIRPATKLRRELTEIDYEEHTASLAESISSLASILNSMEDYPNACDAGKEAVRLNRHLVKRDEAAFTMELAWSLNALAYSQAKLGQTQEAMRNQKESVSHYRDLIANEPGNYLEEIAEGIKHLSELQSDNGLDKKALESAQEATSRFRQLALDNPAYKEQLSSSLNIVAHGLAHIGQYGAALETAREATRIDRQLTHESSRYNPLLARSLGNLATIFSALNQHSNALASSQNASEIYRELAEREPATYQPKLAASLNNLSFFFASNKQKEPALNAAEEATFLTRSIVNGLPPHFSPELAACLVNLSNAQRQLGQTKEAISNIKEAVELYQALSKQLPDRYTIDLVSALGVMAQTMMEKRNQYKSALNCFNEALFLLAPYYELNPAAHKVLAQDLITEYKESCNKLKKKTDPELLKPYEKQSNTHLQYF